MACRSWDLANKREDAPRSQKGISSIAPAAHELLELVVELVMSSEGSNVQMLGAICTKTGAQEGLRLHYGQ